MNKITINGDVIKTALKFVQPAISNEATRYYLNGVYFDKQKGEKLFLIATDGHRCHKIAVGEVDDTEFNFLLPKHAVITLIKTLEKYKTYIFTFSEVMSVGYVNDDITYGLLTVPPIDGKFPDYRRVIPKTEKRAEFDSFNARYLAEAGKAFGLLGKSVGISAFQEEKGRPTIFKVTVYNDTDAMIILMSMRD